MARSIPTAARAIHILRKIMIRVGAKLDWLILKLH